MLSIDETCMHAPYPMAPSTHVKLLEIEYTPSIPKKPDVLGVVLIFAKPDVLDARPLRGRVYP